MDAVSWWLARFSSDVDIVVPDAAEAYGVLSISSFKESAGSSMMLTDRRSVEMGSLKLPLPTAVSHTPAIADLKTPIEI
jgi:hypothetical protein